MVSAGKNAAPDYAGEPIKPENDVIVLRDERGWFYWYAHLKTIEARAGRYEQARTEPEEVFYKDANSSLTSSRAGEECRPVLHKCKLVARAAQGDGSHLDPSGSRLKAGVV